MRVQRHTTGSVRYDKRRKTWLIFGMTAQHAGQN
jgi:hypothetical protein